MVEAFYQKAKLSLRYIKVFNYRTRLKPTIRLKPPYDQYGMEGVLNKIITNIFSFHCIEV